MARRKSVAAVSVDGVRALQAVKDCAALRRLPESALHGDVAGMVRGRRARLGDRIAQLKAGGVSASSGTNW